VEVAAAAKGQTTITGEARKSIAQRLREEPYIFDFFQAVRLLGLLHRDPRTGQPSIGAQAVRFRALISMVFPPSAIHEITPAEGPDGKPTMYVTFMGLTGPSGVLPRHYTEMQMQLARLSKESEKYALRDWFDLFNHRLLDLFYRAWEKYRFFMAYERAEYGNREPDAFSTCLFSLIGIGLPTLRNRLRASEWSSHSVISHLAEDEAPYQERILSQIDDLAMLRYGGVLSQRHRSAVGLAGILEDYFEMPVKVKQFQGQWLTFEKIEQSRLGMLGANSTLGVDVVVGQRSWDVQAKIRIRLGPLDYWKFTEFLPDRSAIERRKAFFMLVHLVRFYVGQALDFDVQLILKARQVPACRLNRHDDVGARLGWNTWIVSRPLPKDAEDVVLEGIDMVWMNGLPPQPPPH